MKVSVRVRGEWLQVPCKKGDETIQWLSEEAVRRYFAHEFGHLKKRKSDVVAKVRKTRGGAILAITDKVADVLDDNEFVSVVLDSDRPNPVTDQTEINFIPEQIAAKDLPTDQYLTLDGNTLTPEDLVMLGRGHYRIRLSHESEEKIRKSRELVDSIIKQKKVVYGITTGFGKFAQTVIPLEQIEEVQVNLIRSHAAGVGNPLTPDKTRMLLALRINVLAKGYSGISIKTLSQYIEAFNASCLPWVPEKGTVGASGDLAPLSHLALGFLGEGKMWSPRTGWGSAQYVLESHGLQPISLGAKEGLALINGTQLISSFGAEAVVRAENIIQQGDVVAALTLEVMKGTSRAFDSSVMKLRNHKGQQEVARRLTALLHSDTYPSEIAESHRFCNRVQDAYTLRCCPQVHGIVHDTVNFVRNIITDELNSATDNPVSIRKNAWF